jgi:hypothetical protein
MRSFNTWSTGIEDFRSAIFNPQSVITGARTAQWYSSGLQVGWSGVPIPAGVGNFSRHHSVRTGSGAQLASSYPKGLFPWGLSGRGVKLTTHLHLVPMSRICGAIPPLSTPPIRFHVVVLSWKHRDNFTLPFRGSWCWFMFIWVKLFMGLTKYNAMKQWLRMGGANIYIYIYIYIYITKYITFVNFTSLW